MALIHPRQAGSRWLGPIRTVESDRVSPRQFSRVGLLVLIATLVTGTAAGCAGNPAGVDTRAVSMAPMSGLPANVQSAPVSVQQAYQFAVANPDVLKAIPCYCGCGAEGHTSNYSCYIAGQNPGGTIRFDSHALGCSICVDITQDAIGMLARGKTPQEIRSTVDQNYSRYGPSNMPR
jgi:hypothetical protein